jgi:recombination protein RecR
MNETLNQLAQMFKEFPGIGERQAKRFAYFVILKNKNFRQDLSRAILEAGENIGVCKECFRFFEKNDKNLCKICTKETTSKKTLMVVEKDSDIDAMERSHAYKGMYFVLGGLITITDEKILNEIKLKELIARIKRDGDILEEIILAFSLTPHGDHTDMVIREKLTATLDNTNIKIRSLGKGLSTGSELEYADNETIKNALENRH